MTWLVQWWADILSPVWWAEFTQTLIAASLAFAAAVMVLRRQLRHDRDLAREQRQQDLEQAEADRQAARGELIGRRIIETVRPLDRLDSYEYARTVRETVGQNWGSGTPMPGLTDAYDIFSEMRLVTDASVHDPYWGLWVTRMNIWQIAHGELLELDRSHELGDTETEAFVTAFHGAVDELIHSTTVLLSRFGQELVRWDGHGSWPKGESRRAPEQPEAVAPYARPDQAEWARDQLRALRDNVRRRLAP